MTRAYLELIRVFLAPSAVADSYAGLFLGWALTGRGGDSRTMLGVAALSLLLYWLGMAANDLFDLPRDRVRAPGRPLPSGRVSPRGVLVFLTALAASAALLALLLEVLPLAAALAAAALAYDAGVKKIPVAGNALMGACRGLNFLLGAAASLGVLPALGSPDLLLGAGILGLYVAGVTAASRLEDAPPHAARLTIPALFLGVIPAALIALAWQSALAWLNGIVLAATIAGALARARAPSGPHHPAQVFVRSALGGIYFVDAGLLVAFSPPSAPALQGVIVLYLLALLAWRWKLRWMARGSEGS